MTIRKIQIGPVDPQKTQFQFRLQTETSEQSDAIEFELSGEQMMYLMNALQRLQQAHKIPIPSSLRPSGPPALIVVTD